MNQRRLGRGAVGDRIEAVGGRGAARLHEFRAAALQLPVQRHSGEMRSDDGKVDLFHVYSAARGKDGMLARSRYSAARTSRAASAQAGAISEMPKPVRLARKPAGKASALMSSRFTKLV